MTRHAAVGTRDHCVGPDPDDNTVITARPGGAVNLVPLVFTGLTKLSLSWKVSDTCHSGWSSAGMRQ